MVVSIANGNEQESKQLISTAYIALLIICLLVFVCFCGIDTFIKWDIVLNAPNVLRDELGTLALFVFGALLLQLVLSLIVNILQAFQVPAYGDLIGVLGQFLSFLGVLLVPFFL